jgi:hypothetical protein
MVGMSVARNQRGALTQAGAGIAASRRYKVDFRAAIRVFDEVNAKLSAQGEPPCPDCLRALLV